VALTPNSGSSPYLDPATFLSLRDLSLFQQLWVDGEAITSAPPTYATLLADPLILFVLGEASGKLESAAVRGGRYLPPDLAALGGNSKAHMQGIVNALAFEFYRRKRGSAMAPLPEYADALEELKQLETGQTIFSFAEAEAAGVAQSARMAPADILRLGLASDRANRVFPRRRCGY
jgi:hypothetical protein